MQSHAHLKIRKKNLTMCLWHEASGALASKLFVGKMYALLTKHEFQMDVYWPSSFLRFNGLR